MIDVRDSQSPNHLWHLCTAPGQDPWRANLSLGRLVANIILSQAPRRRTKVGEWGSREGEAALLIIPDPDVL
jgi:hypothetical protein